MEDFVRKLQLFVARAMTMEKFLGKRGFDGDVFE
jgi:hypothetical protein